MENNVKTIKVEYGDPSTLGLFGLAMVTLVASSQKLGMTDGLSFVIPWAIFLGGFAQLIACFGDFKRNNAFGATAFGGYALFWFSVASSWLIKLGVFGPILKEAVDGKQLGVAFVGYLIFTLFMTVGAMKANRVLFTIFFMINFLFVGLSMSSLGIMPEFGHMLAAYSEVIISLLSFYCAAGTLLNAHYGETVLPLGKPLK